MEKLGPATSDDVVLAFLQAEIDSEYGRLIVDRCAKLGFDRSVLIDNPDSNNSQANRARATILDEYKAYERRDNYLFQGFPNDTEWRRALLDLQDIGRLKYVNFDPFVNLTNGTRLVADGARNYKSYPKTAEKVDLILKKLSHGDSFPDLVLVEDAHKQLVIIEGNHRATAYAVDARAAKFKALVGTSPSMQHWPFI
jgi:hypothetical protein